MATEEPLEIRVSGRSIAVVMRTPGHDRELAAGFLWSEGVIRSRDDVLDIVHCGDRFADPDANRVDVLLRDPEAVDWEALTRHVFAGSSCGVCGKATIESLRQAFPPVAPPTSIPRALLTSLPSRLRGAQPAFDQTGGVHACAIFSSQGELVAVREDVGRHNALDKLIGFAFFSERLPLADTILMVSGRASFEIMQKALSAGIGAVAAVSAPTSLAVDFARAHGQVLIGFLRGDGMNVYAGAESVAPR